MADAPQLQLTRRAFGFGASALASSAALGLGRARAQPATCVVGTWGGDYQNLLDANIVKSRCSSPRASACNGTWRRRAGARTS